jgi:hypothetical protein
MSTKSEAYAAYLNDIYAEYDSLAEGVLASNDLVLSAEEREYKNLGSAAGDDIMAVAFIIMMEAAKSAREDLKAILEEMKAANRAKGRLREALRRLKDALNDSEDKGDADSSQEDRNGNNARAGCDALDVDLAVQLMLMVAAQQSDHELQALADEVVVVRERRKRAKKRGASKEELDSLSELSELMQLRLQMLLDRRAKMIEMLSNILKKLSETQDAIIGNLK